MTCTLTVTNTAMDGGLPPHEARGQARGVQSRAGQAEVWIAEGWLSLGVFVAFFLAVALSRTPTAG